MSATGRRRKRIGRDVYETPSRATQAFLDAAIANPRLEALLKSRSDLHPYIVLDPCAGSGAILRVVSSMLGLQTAAIEIRPETEAALAGLCGDRVKIGDGLVDVPPVNGSPVIVITNPPFSVAEKFVRRFIDLDASAYLLRLNFMGAKGRLPLFWRYPPAFVYVLCERPSFAWTCKTKDCAAEPVPVGTTTACADCGAPVGPGHDATEFAWFVWMRGNKEPTQVYWLMPPSKADPRQGSLL